MHLHDLLSRSFDVFLKHGSNVSLLSDVVLELLFDLFDLVRKRFLLTYQEVLHFLQEGLYIFGSPSVVFIAYFGVVENSFLFLTRHVDLVVLLRKLNELFLVFFNLLSKFLEFLLHCLCVLIVLCLLCLAFEADTDD